MSIEDKYIAEFKTRYLGHSDQLSVFISKLEIEHIKKACFDFIAWTPKQTLAIPNIIPRAMLVALGQHISDKEYNVISATHSKNNIEFFFSCKTEEEARIKILKRFILV